MKDAECGYWRGGEFVWDVTVILGFDWLILLSDWLISVTCQNQYCSPNHQYSNLYCAINRYYKLSDFISICLGLSWFYFDTQTMKALGPRVELVFRILFLILFPDEDICDKYQLTLGSIIFNLFG